MSSPEFVGEGHRQAQGPFFHFRNTNSSSYQQTENLILEVHRLYKIPNETTDPCPAQNTTKCICGEHGKRVDWVWGDCLNTTNIVILSNENKDARFHSDYSNGTAVIRGAQPIRTGQHYWEVKMISPVYGTDMMIGVGTEETHFGRVDNVFCSALGSDDASWGLSYTGAFHHGNISNNFGPRFDQGSIIGVHLDMWNGVLSYYKNRKFLGVAATNLKGKTLYPMASSTAARSGMRIIQSCSFPSSLQFFCCSKLRTMVPCNKKVLNEVPVPVGLRKFLENNLSWLLGEDQLDDNILKKLLNVHFKCRYEDPCDSTDKAFDFEEQDVPLTSGVETTLVPMDEGPAVFYNFSRFMPSEERYETSVIQSDFSEDTSEDDEEPNKKSSYNYAVGLSDDESD